jgi:hypothetical protein
MASVEWGSQLVAHKRPLHLALNSFLTLNWIREFRSSSSESGEGEQGVCLASSISHLPWHPFMFMTYDRFEAPKPHLRAKPAVPRARLWVFGPLASDWLLALPLQRPHIRVSSVQRNVSSMSCRANRFEPMGMTSEILGAVLPILPRDPSPM